jgi:two-component sensor histidine kinase
VTITCETDPRDGARIVEWAERDGPPVAGPPARQGFGRRLLERGESMQEDMGANLRFEPEGLRCTLRLPSPRSVHPDSQA